jgi:hypothetical protein
MLLNNTRHSFAVFGFTLCQSCMFHWRKVRNYGHFRNISGVIVDCREAAEFLRLVEIAHPNHNRLGFVLIIFGHKYQPSVGNRSLFFVEGLTVFASGAKVPQAHP